MINRTGQLAACGIVLVIIVSGASQASAQTSGQAGQTPYPVVVKGTDPFAGLNDTRWTLTSAKLSVPPPDDTSRITLDFHGGTLSMSSGCNRGNTSYTVSPADHRLGISTYTLTRMACPGPVMDWETAFFKFLGSRPAVTREAEALVLKSGDAEMRFKRVLK
jgi:heat shock protein HslJ